jgi:uncharacterized protein DUF4265
MTDTERPTVKLLFRVPNEDGSFEIETLWAYNLGEDRFKIDNFPFYAYSVSADDIVYAPFDPDEGHPTFQKILTKSGNRTIRVIFDAPVETGNRSDEVLQGLVAIGCGYEGANSKYFAVNIPPVVDLNAVRDYLIKCGAQWEYADPTYDELYPSNA